MAAILPPNMESMCEKTLMHLSQCPPRPYTPPPPPPPLLTCGSMVVPATPTTKWQCLQNPRSSMLFNF